MRRFRLAGARGSYLRRVAFDNRPTLMYGKVEVFSFWVIHVELFLDRISRFVRQAVKKPSVRPGEAQKRGDPELRLPDEPRRTTFSDTETAVVAAIAILTATVQAPDRFNFLFSACN